MQADEIARHRKFLTAGVWIIATIGIGYALNQGKDIFGPFALAALIWLVLEGLARELHRRIQGLPLWAGHLIAISGVVIGVALAFGIIRDAVQRFMESSGGYEASLNDSIVNVYAMLGLSEPPKVAALLKSNAVLPFVQPAIEAAQSTAGTLALVMIYIGFLYFAGSAWTTKMVNIFPIREDRKRALHVIADIRRAMERYLWVQTVLSLITSVLTYFTLLAMGLQNALFWSFVIFFLNYIPTLGSIVAAALPTLFALVQDPHTWPPWMPHGAIACALVVFLGVSVWQFGIGNFVSPRMTGNSLNIAPLTVLLSLAVWGGIWGGIGVFLSAPLTVLVMIILAEIPGARWIAVLISEDGNPGGAIRLAAHKAQGIDAPQQA
jgi:predicted PurR-regulated permease PerM